MKHVKYRICVARIRTLIIKRNMNPHDDVITWIFFLYYRFSVQESIVDLMDSPHTGLEMRTIFPMPYPGQLGWERRDPYLTQAVALKFLQKHISSMIRFVLS